jgi:hypothetical protein
MRFGTCYDVSLCKLADQVSSRGILKYKLDLLEVQEVQCERVGYQILDNYTFFPRKRER